ncbi:MAG TPA: trypsin-like peptidase domain-containing protein [Acidimicrobiia bacterium]|nr:trypsin-like peptidase domain-containing protein [Acidimicrobiia bacterium]
MNEDDSDLEPIPDPTLSAPAAPDEPIEQWWTTPGPPLPPADWWSRIPPPGAGPPSPPPRRRLGAVVAIIALVLASAGIGAAITSTVVHDSTKSQPQFGNPSPDTNSASSNGRNGSAGPLDASAVTKKIAPAIVNIDTTLNDGLRAAGTGIVIDPNGQVLTNNHVIADATSIKVTFGSTGDSHTAKVVGYDVTDDIALLRVDGVSNAASATLGDVGKLKVGDNVIAIGNALGRGGAPTVTQGKVTGLDQHINAGNPGGAIEQLSGLIQTDAPIQPGDSGGALVNAAGEVIGINTAASANGFGRRIGSSVGYAIPVNSAVSVVRLIRNGTETDRVHIGDRALLGVDVRDADISVSAGALVTGVEDNTPASDAGIAVGDVIVAVAGQSVADSSALHTALSRYHPGDRVSVDWEDEAGTRHSATVSLTVGPPA